MRRCDSSVRGDAMAKITPLPNTRVLFLAALGLLFMAVGQAAALAADPGMASFAPSLRHPSHGTRMAVLLVPGSAQSNARNAVAHADEEIYRKLLRDLGFDVVTIGPSSRPDLDQGLRDVARRVPAGGEVALFVLGTTLSGGNELYLMPLDAPANAESQPGGLDTAGTRLGDVLRRIAGRTPRHVVVIVDECRRVDGAGCAVDPAPGGTGASIIAAYRVNATAGGGEPLARRSSLRELLTPEMVKEGQTFHELFAALRPRLSRSDIALATTSALSTEFAFVPANYFATLPTDCNRVDAGADTGALRNANLDPLVQACERAVATWPYVPRFATQLAVAREQRTFQRAVARCENHAATSAYLFAYPSGQYKAAVQQFDADCRTREEDDLYRRAILNCGDLAPAGEYQRNYPTGRYKRQVDEFVAACRMQEEDDLYRRAVLRCTDLAPAGEYRRTYPTGRYKRQVDEFVAACAPPPPLPSRKVAQSRIGWSLTYDGELLHISPRSDDFYNAERNSYETVWHSLLHGEKVSFYVQVSRNEGCRTSLSYAQERIVPRRLRSTRQPYAMNQADAVMFESTGLKVGPRVVDGEIASVDFISIRNTDKGTVVHIGGRFPPEERNRYRAELMKMLSSWTYPTSPPFNQHCP
jgi:hypothetical protein